LPLKLNKLNEAKNETPSCAKPDQRKKKKEAKRPEDKQICARRKIGSSYVQNKNKHSCARNEILETTRLE
jgi:hypothetical protein